jgi:hypothetical protein
MSSPVIVYRGSDEQVIVKLWEDCNKTIPVNIDDLNDLEVRVIVGPTVIAQYNKTGSGDFTALTRVDEYTYYFWLETDNDTKTGLADIWFEAITDDAELQDNLDNTIQPILKGMEIKQKPY